MLILFALIVFVPLAHAQEGDAQVETSPIADEGQVEQQELPPADTGSPAYDGSVDESSSADTDAGRELGNGTSTSTPAKSSSVDSSTRPSGTGFVPLAPIPGLTKGVTADQAGLANFFNNLYIYLIGLGAILAVIEIIWGGLLYATQDIPGQKNAGKEKIQQAILGLVLILAPVLVFSIINPAILNLSVNMPALNTRSGVSSGTPAAGTNQPTVPESGCNVREGKYLETATCKTNADANNYKCKNGGSLIVTACQKKDPSGKCLDTGYSAYCSQSITVIYQKATHLFGLVPGWDSKVIPRDAQKEAEFTATCQSNGGRADSSKTLGAKIRVYSRPVNYLSPVLSGGCPEDSGIVIETAKQYDVICFDQTLACTP